MTTTYSTVTLAKRISDEIGKTIYPSSIRHFIENGRIAATWKHLSPLGVRGEWEISQQEADRVVELYKKGGSYSDTSNE